MFALRRVSRVLFLGLAALVALSSCATPGIGGGMSSAPAARPERSASLSPHLPVAPSSMSTGPSADVNPGNLPAIDGSSALLIPASSPSSSGLEKIQHFVFIMQENRSFDSYFGTYPGADGIPAGVCLVGAKGTSCVKPYHDQNLENVDPPHDSPDVVASVAGGRMNGFLAQAFLRVAPCGGIKLKCVSASDLRQVMGYHDAREIPNYWTYAQHFVLQDHMFSSALTYTLPNRLYAVSGQSGGLVARKQGVPSTLDVRSMMDVLTQRGVSWKDYVATGTHLDPKTGQVLDRGTSAQRSPLTSTYYNPVPLLTSLRADPRERQSLVDVTQFYQDARTGQLPEVSWVTPDAQLSEHPPYNIRTGMDYVTGLVNAAMDGPDWNSTAIFISYDEGGGFYDHVAPPRLDQYGAGVRVPGLVISPYAKAGYVDHTVYTSASWLRLIEERFGLPALTARDATAADMRAAFDFSQEPRPPLVLPVVTANAPASPPAPLVPNDASAVLRPIPGSP